MILLNFATLLFQSYVLIFKALSNRQDIICKFGFLKKNKSLFTVFPGHEGSRSFNGFIFLQVAGGKKTVFLPSEKFSKPKLDIMLIAT